MDAAVAGVMKLERSAVATAMFVRLGAAVNRTLVLPLLIFYPTSRCNSRCVSCDWWKHGGEDDLTLREIASIADALGPLGTRVVAFSGGEPLLRPDVFEAAALFRSRGLSLQLLTSGVLLERTADRVAEQFSRVFVSLDAATADGYEAIRGVNALAAVGRGVARLRRLAPGVPVTARTTLHRANFRELPRIIEHAKAIGVDGISFLAADTSSTAFGRSGFAAAARPSASASPASLALSRDEAAEFAALVERTVAVYEQDFESGFVSESPAKLRRLPQYYAALQGDGAFPPVSCNAPWVSVVIEADGAVRPCFFHPPVGNLRTTPLADLVTRNLRAFRSTLDVAANPTCARCVCTLNAGMRNAPWLS
jgi:MoaA/NifB/PqqE/SkfB family radical SAM enzyme